MTLKFTFYPELKQLSVILFSAQVSVSNTSDVYRYDMTKWFSEYSA